MKERLKRLLAIRYRISTQLYLGIGGAVAMTIAASLVGLFSFNSVGEAQSRVNEGSVPEMAAAFGVARLGGILVAAGPSLTAAETIEEFTDVSAGIADTHRDFEEQLAVLEKDGQDKRFEGIRADASTLIRNLESIEEGMLERFELADRTDALRLELAIIRADLDTILVPALDDQLFYTMTGYRKLGAPAEPRDVHFSEGQLIRFRYMAELQAQANIATQLLASASTLSDSSLIEPLRERFESSAGHIERNLGDLEGPLCTRIWHRSLAGCLELGTGDGNGFDLFARELALAGLQGELLADNRAVAVSLIEQVDELVADAQLSTREATQASSQAVFTGSTLLLVISFISLGGALLIIWLFVGRVLLRRLGMLSTWMRRMAGGDLEARVEIGGRDEVAEMAGALEVFRRHALEIQRLNLVEKLANELQGKNEELEQRIGRSANSPRPDRNEGKTGGSR